jgi:hypothetical protein
MFQITMRFRAHSRTAVSQYGPYFMSTYCHLKLGVGSYIYKQICAPLVRTNVEEMHTSYVPNE